MIKENLGQDFWRYRRLSCGATIVHGHRHRVWRNGDGPLRELSVVYCGLSRRLASSSKWSSGWTRSHRLRSSARARFADSRHYDFVVGILQMVAGSLRLVSSPSGAPSVIYACSQGLAF